LTISEFFALYARHPQIANVNQWVQQHTEKTLSVQGLIGSSRALLLAAVFQANKMPLLVLHDDAESAAYLYHDLTQLLGNESVYFLPSSFKRKIKYEQVDTANEILRTEVLNAYTSGKPCIVISSPEGVMEKVASQELLKKSSIPIHVGEALSQDFLIELLYEEGFEKVDFVYEPGQYSVRGSIVDVFSYSCEQPYRIDFFGNEVESIRLFDIETQLSKEKEQVVTIVADLQRAEKTELTSLFEFIPKETVLCFTDFLYVKDKINQLYDEALVGVNDTQTHVSELKQLIIAGDDFKRLTEPFRKMEVGTKRYFKSSPIITFSCSPQPLFHKNFDLVFQSFKQSLSDGYSLYILSDNKKQTDRIQAIFEDKGENIVFTPVLKTLHDGFIDHDMALCCYTDHQLFDRFHKFSLRSDKARLGKIAMTLKELGQFQIGDYVVHVDHGVGRFGGLLTTEMNGKKQEVVKLLYKDDDIIFVSIHALHRISKYKGKEGEAPRVNKLGTGAWERLKERTKKKVKDIARELIQLYAKRKAQQGYAFSPDSYLQQELEASFLYEDTPDQFKATTDVKKDMQSILPMDRLVCGDVGFGKTEVAMRAAFKAVSDSKQVAVLVPTTVLALQHYKTFTERLKDFPCTVEYLSRARKAGDVKEILHRLSEGKVDIIIGTHKLVGKEVKFKDLGLLIIDEEQKFGVSVKEKLKEMKVNVDTLTLTATPIPRTLQFSLMGARDLSIINTPPPNRFPIQTEVHEFDEVIMREAIVHEMERNGQVFVVNNRIQNIYQIEALVKRLVPDARVVVGHGQMDPDKLEKAILDFIDYEYDVLVATSIIESGVDIPNVNTIIINNAHSFGLSDLHQLRGRVGRSNRKAYCYLFAPPVTLLTPEARRRLQAIETFAELGSGFNLSMQDLDIRGAGNMLGAEQSGFIADLGYETYQKILNEAVAELKDEEFADLYADDSGASSLSSLQYVSDCLVESDLEVMFPSDYIENVSERITLYRELDNVTDEESLGDFQKRLEDRFGKLPQQAESLLQMLRLRWLAISLGIEKVILKEEKMIAYLVNNMHSHYYLSEAFGAIINYMAKHPKNTQLREKNSRRYVVFTNIPTIDRAYTILYAIRQQ
jgi:transcription-repair coupling factor (superfamily II helicase)